MQEGLFERVTGTYAELPPLPRGRLYTYPVVADESGHTRLDLGFGIHCGPAVVALNAVVPGDMAESRGAEPPATVPFAAHRVGWTDDEANAYLARVRRVVDGDTLVVTVDLGFAVEVGQTLRLRGIDGPELSRQAGERAREFVRQALLLGVAHLESSKTESTASRSAARRDPPEALDFLLPLSRLLRLEA